MIPRKVLIDGRPMAGPTGRRGVGRYVRGLLAGLASLADGPALAALVDPRDEAATLPDGVERVAAVAPPGPALLWGRLLGPRWLRAAHPDLWHATFTAPPRVPRAMPWVATIHDLIPLRHGSVFTLKQRVVFERSLRACAGAHRVIAVSVATARLVRDTLGVPAGRIDVVPPPIDTARLARAGGGARPVEGPYLLHLGGLDPLKGVDLLVPAFGAVAPAHPGLHLVFSGVAPSDGPVAAALRASPCAERIAFAGRLDDDAHAEAIAGAAAVVVASREEGFGMPVAEALAAGVPVAVGPAEASREAAGLFGHLAPGDSPAALALAIEDALSAGPRESAEGDARRAYARRFDVAEVARLVLETYGRALGAP